MDATEIKRREAEAVRDIAAAAIYHANRLPVDSAWREVLCDLGGAFASELSAHFGGSFPLSPDLPPEEPAKIETVKSRAHLQVVV